MDLQQSLDRFKADLEAYIQAEVSRQLVVQTSVGVTRLESRSLVENTSAANNDMSIQASLDELAALAQVSTPAKGDDAVNRLVNEYGGATQVLNSAHNGDYLSELSQLGQHSDRAADMSAYDALTSMSSQVNSTSTASQPSRPVSATVTNTSNVDGAEQLSGIQSFLQKIRQRKNLSSN